MQNSRNRSRAARKNASPDREKQRNQEKTFWYYDGDQLCTVIRADYGTHTVEIQNHTDDPVLRAFGVHEHPDWESFQAFLEDRCMPRSRAGLQDWLESMGLYEYDPLDILRKTEGRMAEDHQWLRILEQEGV